MKLYEVNSKFFDKINSPAKAYFLGWVVSDGSVSKKNTLSLRLQIEDIKILEILRKVIESTNTIKLISYKNTIHSHWKDQAGLVIHNKKICESLRKLGYNNTKTQTAKFPKFLSKKLIPHFLRGLFEGDGCLSIRFIKTKSNMFGFYPTPKAQFYICGTQDMCEGVKSSISKLNIFSKIKKAIGHYKIIISGNENIFKIVNWLYKDCDNLFLKRKYDLFKKLEKLENRDKSKDFHHRKRPIRQLDLEGNLIRVWPSAADAIKSMGVKNTGALVSVLKKRKWFKTYKGFKWEYV